MKKLTENLWAKVAAFFLYVFTVLGMCYSGAIMCANMMARFYEFPNSIDFNSILVSCGYRAESSFFELARYVCKMRYHAIVIFAVLAIFLIVLYIFILNSAGHKSGVDGINLSFFDRIPLDIVFGVDCLIAFFALLPLFDQLLPEMYQLSLYYGYYNSREPIIVSLLMTVCILVIMLVFLRFSTTFAARVKAGKWWQNSVIYIVLKFAHGLLKKIKGFLAEFFHAIPIVWKTALISALLIIVNSFLVILAFDGCSEFASIALLFLNLAFFAGAILMSFQLNKLKIAGDKLSKGEFDYKTGTDKMFWEFKKHAENLNSIGDGMATAVEQRMHSERLKTELITNVSHDIKTPLTSIVNYVDLLANADNDEDRKQYTEVLTRQAQRLRKLTEDLIEASKASTGNISVNLVPTNTDELVNQALGEYTDKLSASGLTPIYTCPEIPVVVMADGKLLWRVMDNLLSNAVKYAQSGTRLYIDVSESGTISFKNISRDRLNISADELMERFVRGDSSRSTSGSGLGLNIARSLTELMGGTFEVTVDGDLFKAEIHLKCV